MLEILSLRMLLTVGKSEYRRCESVKGLVWTRCRRLARWDAGKWSPDIRSKVSDRTSYVSRSYWGGQAVAMVSWSAHWRRVRPAVRPSGRSFLTRKEYLSVTRFTEFEMRCEILETNSIIFAWNCRVHLRYRACRARHDVDDDDDGDNGRPNNNEWSK